MKASKFTDAQKAFVIKQDEEGTPVAAIYRNAGISQATHFNWKKKYTGLMPSEMRQLRQMASYFGMVVLHDFAPVTGLQRTASPPGRRAL